MNRRLTILLMADLVGYSALMERDPDAALQTIRELRSDALEPVAAGHGGEVLKRMGDGWIIAFGSVAAAFECAKAIQTGLASHPTARLRIGCHMGEIVEEDGDFYGAGVNLAQRIQTEAPPGGLMISEDMHRQLSPSEAAELSDAGTFSLKNISRPVRLYQWRPGVAGSPAVSSGEIPSIAIGPIASAPADEETKAVAGDIREQLVIRLSRRKGVRIVDDAEGAAQDTTYLLRPRLRLARDKGRFSLSLILREDASPVWSENYDGDASDVFAFSDQVLEEAEGDLRVHTNAFDGDRLAHLSSDSLSVSELRARAANLFYKMSYEGWEEGRLLMERAVALSPDDPISLTMRAEAEILTALARFEEVGPERAATMAEEMDFAVEAASRSDYVLWARGFYRSHVAKDVSGARADLRRSRELNDAYLENHELEGHIRLQEGDYAGAVEAFGRLTQRGASNIMLPYRLYLRSLAHLCAGDAAAACDDATAAADYYPKTRRLHALRAICAEKAGETALAARARARADELPVQPGIVGRKVELGEAGRWIMEALARE